MKSKVVGFIGLGCLVAVSLAQGASYPKAEKIVGQTCAACHGADGNSSAPENPVLAGQTPEYIERQLEHFQKGIRQNPIMQGMASPLSQDDIHELGHFFAEQTIKPHTSKDPQLVEAGRIIYRAGVSDTGVPACMACHGPTGAGIPVEYPRIGGQHAAYILKQLKAFKHGDRGASKSDNLGRIMADIASKMSEEQMAAVAEYVSALR